MSLAPDIAVGVAQRWRVRVVVERDGVARRELTGDLLAVGWDADREHDFTRHDRLVLLLLDTQTSRLTWIREDEVAQIARPDPEPGATARSVKPRYRRFVPRACS